MARSRLRIELLAGRAPLERGWRRIEGFLDANARSQRERYVAAQVFEEAVGNIFERAPEPTPGCRVEIYRTGAIVMTISDAGRPFDPTWHPLRAASSELEQAPDGGRGNHLMRSMARAMRYSRRVGRNWLEVHIGDAATVAG